jgi:hypothetical protein
MRKNFHLRFAAGLTSCAGKTICLALICMACACAAQNKPSDARWWKGNLHTHSLWSDGDDYPEMIVGWYHRNGYHFLSLSDHNVMLTGEKWVTVTTNRNSTEAFNKYRKHHGPDWLETRVENGVTKVRLKTLEEFRGKFESPRFLLIPGEEISDRFEKLPIHLNATNLRELIPPQGGNSVVEVMQRNIDAVLEQRRRTGQAMIPHINHPNFVRALTAEDIMLVRGERFMEVYNGHPVTKDLGDAVYASTERIWDIVLTRRLAELGLEPMWGTAVDDAHNYHVFKVGNPNPGRGWVMVRSVRLTPEALIEAMEKGDFYASTGVELKEIRRSAKELCVFIRPERGVTYTTQFIGTRKGYDATSHPVVDKEGNTVRATRRYSADIGKVLAEVEGNSACYKLKGDEIYVRAKVISSRGKENPAFNGDKETAWVQPLVPGWK